MRKTVTEATPAPQQVRSLADSIARDLGVKSTFDLGTVDRLGSPFITGVRRPVIVLPRRCVNDSDATQLRAVLAHELAHARTRDPFWMAFVRCAASLLWFHPLIWRVRSAHSAACEEVCAGVAAAYLGNPQTYS